MDIIRDYLGSNYALFVAYGLLIAWVMGFSLILRPKGKEKKSNLFKKWWFWLGTLICLGHLFLVEYGSAYFGLGTPDHFSEILVTDDEIILFDQEITYYDDDNIGTDDYASHLRIHVVDRNTHEKKFSDLIGTNYSTFIDSNDIFIYYHSSSSNTNNSIHEIKRYDLESKSLETVVEIDEKINFEGNQIKVHSIRIDLAIIATSVQGDEFLYNTNSKLFEEFHGAYPPLPKKTESNSSFYFRAEHYGSDKKILFIDGDTSSLEFLDPNVIDSYQSDSAAYAIILSYLDLEKEEVTYSMVKNNGELLWELDLQDLEKITNHKRISDIQRTLFDGELLYMTADAFLFELELESGKINWWLKL